MGLSNGPRRAVCTEHYGVEANEMLHPSRHKTLSLSCSCEHPRHVLIELRLLVKAPRRRLHTLCEVSMTSERQSPFSCQNHFTLHPNEDFFLTDTSNENASSRTSAVVLTITAAIADASALNVLALEVGLCKRVEHNGGEG